MTHEEIKEDANHLRRMISQYGFSAVMQMLATILVAYGESAMKDKDHDLGMYYAQRSWDCKKICDKYKGSVPLDWFKDLGL